MSSLHKQRLQGKYYLHHRCTQQVFRSFKCPNYIAIFLLILFHFQFQRYRAVIEAANVYQRFLNGEVTAAGKFDACKILVVGAGVAGLAAIGSGANSEYH